MKKYLTKFLFYTGGLFWIAVLGGAGCAAASKYPFFALDITDACYKQGTLRAVGEDGEHDPDLDEPLENCKDSGECLVQKTLIEERQLTDLLACQEQLKACEE
jgi:hypothetical protein